MHRKKVQSKKMCALILAGVMVFGSSQTAAFAIQGEDGSGATGSDTDTASGYTITIPENLEDGTYTGTATVEHDEDEDFNEYPISVEVTVADGAVTGITVSGASGQNTQYSYRAESGISEQVVGNTAGTYEVDTVSTATCSSVAIISAVNEALEGEASDTSISLGEAVYDPDGTAFTITIMNPAEDVDYSDISISYAVGKFSSDLTADEDYTTELLSSSDTEIVYQVVIGNTSFNVDDDDYEHDEMTYNTLGQNLDVAVNGTTVGRIVISSCATVTLENNTLSLTGGNGETLADYLELASEITLSYISQDDEEVSTTYTLQWAHDVEPEYTSSDFFNEDGSINFDIAPFVYGAAGTYTITVTCSGFADVTAQIGSVTEETVTDTLVVRRGNTYYFSCSLKSGDADEVITYGKITDEVLVGDWDGDGVDTLCVRRGNMYYFSNSLKSGDADMVICYGKETDEVLVGDWNGDGCDTLAVRRGNQYYFKNSLSGGDADYTVAYGKVTDEVLAGKWSGNASGTVNVKDTLAVRRGNIYYIKNALADGAADIVVTYGKSTDTAFAGDWDGDGFDTLAVRRGNICYLQAEIEGNVALSQIVYGKVTDEVYAGVWSS
ncbi:MAG: FMN-binding protein [Clostridiales bacterium]|nr:FMN-binding protein [Clostridiales bacterium]